MIVRELEKQERKYALDIIWSVFCMDVAEVYEQEGIDTFRSFVIIMCADPAREKVLEGYFLTMRKGIVRKNCIRLL